jgi:hypothetical protein
VPRHVARLVTWRVAPLVIDYFACAARPSASECRAARHGTRRRLLRPRRAPECLGTSCGSSRGSSSTTLPRAGSSSTTAPTPRVRVPRLVVRLLTWLVVDYFASHRLVFDYCAYAARPGASARRAARHVARRRLLRLAQARRQQLRLRRASGCLGTSRGLSLGSSSTTSPPPCVRMPRHVARLVTRLVVDYFALRRLVVGYFAYAARSSASTRRAARHTARRRLLHLRRSSGGFGTSRGLSHDSSSTTSPCVGSSSTTSPTSRVRVPRHVA